jgi:hypothetical protein
LYFGQPNSPAGNLVSNNAIIENNSIDIIQLFYPKSAFRKYFGQQ